MKMKRVGKLMLAGLWALALAGCALTGAAQEEISGQGRASAQKTAADASMQQENPPLEEGKPEMEPMTAMYVPFGEDSYVLVDQKVGTVFTVTMPEELYDVSGEKIAPGQLRAGNILQIEGNGIMLESYPGQYPGVTRMQVMSEGRPEDAERYQQLVDELWQEPDASMPPELSVEYRTPDAAVTAAVPRGSYQWEYTDKDGETRTAAACGDHPLRWGEVLDQYSIRLSGPADLRLLFYPGKAGEVSVQRWPADRRGSSGTEILQGEEAAVEKQDGQFTLLQVEPGYVYQVEAIFENGDALYAFLTE